MAVGGGRCYRRPLLRAGIATPALPVLVRLVLDLYPADQAKAGGLIRVERPEQAGAIDGALSELRGQGVGQLAHRLVGAGVIGDTEIPVRAAHATGGQRFPRAGQPVAVELPVLPVAPGLVVDAIVEHRGEGQVRTQAVTPVGTVQMGHKPVAGTVVVLDPADIVNPETHVGHPFPRHHAGLVPRGEMPGRYIKAHVASRAHRVYPALLVRVPVDAEELVHGLAGGRSPQGRPYALRHGGGRAAVEKEVVDTVEGRVVLGACGESLLPLRQAGETADVVQVEGELEVAEHPRAEIDGGPAIVRYPDLSRLLPRVTVVTHAMDREPRLAGGVGVQPVQRVRGEQVYVYVIGR